MVRKLTKVIFKFRIDKNLREKLEKNGEVNYSAIVNSSLKQLIENNESFILQDNFNFDFDGYVTIGLDVDIYDQIKNISKRTGIRLFYLVNIALLYHLSRSNNGREVTKEWS